MTEEIEMLIAQLRSASRFEVTATKEKLAAECNSEAASARLGNSIGVYRDAISSRKALAESLSKALAECEEE